MNILLLSELVNKGGTRIGGDYKIDQDNSMTTSRSEPPFDLIKLTTCEESTLVTVLGIRR